MQDKLFCTAVMQSYWNKELYKCRVHFSFSLDKDFNEKKEKDQTQQKALKLSLPIPKQVHLVTQTVPASQCNVSEKNVLIT